MSIRILRWPLEYVLVRLALAILPRLSRTTILRLSRLLGTTAYHVMRRARRVGLANLEIALPDRDLVQRKILLRKSLQHFALAMLDTFWLARETSERLRRLVRFDPDFQTKILQKGAQICITAHLGNWEVLGLAVSHQGFPLTSVAAPLKNPWVDELFNRLRHMAGQRAIPKQGAVRQLLKALRDGGKIALVLDQNVKPVQGGLFVDFFGRKAPFSAAAAQLALRTDAPILIGTCIPDERGYYLAPSVITIALDNLPENPDGAVRVLTQRIAAGLEAIIRKYPDCWLWTYKRWKILPTGENPENYPFYTRALRAGDLPPPSRQATPTEPVSQLAESD